MKNVKTTYTFNGVEYNENQNVTLTFKIALRNLQTVLNRWNKWIKCFEVGSLTKVANDIEAKNVKITTCAFLMYNIFEDLGYHATSEARDNVSVCQHKFAPNKSFWKQTRPIAGYFVKYTPGFGWKLVDNTPAVVKGNQLKNCGSLYRRNKPFNDKYFSNK